MNHLVSEEFLNGEQRSTLPDKCRKLVRHSLRKRLRKRVAANLRY
jgi:hypothetical protein